MKIFNNLYKVLFLASIFIFASCSTSIEDSNTTASRDALKISITNSDENSNRVAATPFTAEVLISQDGKTITKKSKDIAREGTTFEFTNLPYNVELKIELNIYVGSENIVATGSKKYIIIPNVDNLVEIDVTTNALNVATLAGSEADKVGAVLLFRGDNPTINISFTEKPNINTLVQSIANAQDYPDQTHFSFLQAGAITLTASELQALATGEAYNRIGTISLAQNSTLELNNANKNALDLIDCSKSTIVYKNGSCNKAEFSSIMRAIKDATALLNITLNLSAVSINEFGDNPKTIPAVNSSNSPTNVTNINLTDIKALEPEALKYFTGLSTITIPSSVTELRYNCFPATANLNVQGGTSWTTYRTEDGISITETINNSTLKTNLLDTKYNKITR